MVYDWLPESGHPSGEYRILIRDRQTGTDLASSFT